MDASGAGRSALAPAHGDVPIACAAVGPDENSAAHNRREVDADPTAHAGILALREAARAIGHWRLEGMSVFVTLSPACAPVRS
jgi:tRNA(adenine34) deaminase